MTDSKIDQPTPGSRKPRVRRGLAIGAAAAALVIIVGVVAFVFVADDGTDVAGSGEVETGPITSFEDIAGTIYKIGPPHEPIYIQFSVDGTWNGSTIRNNLVEDRPSSIYESRFEGTKIFVTETKGFCDANPGAIYEVHLLENGNLEVVAIEDSCAHRSSDFFQAEWEPVP